MLAEINWDILVPGTITALATGYVLILTQRNTKHLKQIGPKVTAIDNAVNGQPPGTRMMVDKVTDISTEQGRVAEELAEATNPTPGTRDPWAVLGEKLDLILAAIQERM